MMSGAASGPFARAGLLLVALATSIACESPPALPPGMGGHTASGIVLPESLGAFERGEWRSDEEEASAAYTRRHLFDQIQATLFVYPAPTVVSIGSPDSVVRKAHEMTLDGSWAEVKEAIEVENPGARLIAEERLTMKIQGQERDGRKADYLYEERLGLIPITLESTAVLFRVDDWNVLFRITAPRDVRQRTRTEVEGFLAAFEAANRGD